ncbi:MAG TPA: NAD(P)H-binding protein [Thermoanaerobaculaceae bacterium]|nr:NAD(P)H-binding protein [Thermoanaerobaculaceae bacterium]
MNAEPLKIALFGAPGATGHEVIASALRRGWRVNALVSHGGELPPAAPHVREIVGGFDSTDAVRRTLEDADAAVIAIGARPPYREVLCAAATRAIIGAARDVGVERLVCLTGALVGTYSENQGRLFLAMFRLATGGQLPTAQDRVDQEDAVRDSGLRWSIVKPPRLTNGARTGRVTLGARVKVGLLSSISRADLADVLLDLCARPDGGGVLFVKRA